MRLLPSNVPAYKIMKNPHHLEVIGMMSGTSLDGLDLAWCRFQSDNPSEFELLAHKTLPYPEALQSRLAKAVNASAEELFALDAELGQYMGLHVTAFIGDKNPPDLLSSHGHTIFHQPHRGFTSQIGSAAHLRATTGLPVVSDFRSLDVARGGQGAPLVPVGDALLFSDYDYCLNLGGIANVSYVHENGSRIAFDITFCNMVLNYLASREGAAYDSEGALAREGSVIDTLAAELRNWSYYSINPPKSLGFEEVSEQILPLLNEGDTRDLLRTCTEHIAEQVIKSCPHDGKMLITGGGAHNTFLRECLESKPGLDIVYPDSWLVDYKEAIVFALLGALRIWNKPNVYASVTGASSDSVSGLYLA